MGDVLGGALPTVQYGHLAGEDLLPPVAPGPGRLAAARPQLPGDLQVVHGLEVALLRRAPPAAQRARWAALCVSLWKVTSNDLGVSTNSAGRRPEVNRSMPAVCV